MTQLHVMTEAELEILAASVEHPNIFFDYWFRKPGREHGWQLDYNFEDAGKWQEEFCMASQSFIVCIAGISTGKTLGAIMSAAYFATLSQYFKFMNVAPTARQSVFMYQALLEQAEGTPFWDLISSYPKRPWPQISIEYMVGNRKHSSLLEMTSLGESGDASHIFSYRGDWINIEEAGQVQGLGEVVSNLVTRLTGSTAEGRPYLGRLSIISNPWENVELWQLYDMAAADEEDGLIFNIDTRANKNTTEKQVKFALKWIPQDLHAKFMTGDRPLGKGTYFPAMIVDSCCNSALTDTVRNGVKEKIPGYEFEELPHMGMFFFKTPKRDGRIYFILGDPGTGTAPSRNAPTLGVFDVTDAPKLTTLVAFWWGNGGGSIMPMVTRIMEWTDYYKPIMVAVDNTGPQKSTAELLTEDYIRGQKKSIETIYGLDFSGGKKYSYLVALRLLMESHSLIWPSACSGIKSQLVTYDPVLDKTRSGKLAQDIVAMLAMAAFSIRVYYNFNQEEDGEEVNRSLEHIGEIRRKGRDETRSHGGGRDGTGKTFSLSRTT
jgi:hypothetical protein